MSCSKSFNSSLYISKNDADNVNFHFCWTISVAWYNICSTARGIIPRMAPFPLPCIVCVLPDPVWPYENRHTWYPSIALCTKSETSSNTWSCPDDCGNTLSNVKLYGVTVRASKIHNDSPSGDTSIADLTSFPSLGKKGRVRTNTRMFPRNSWIRLCICRRKVSQAWRSLSNSAIFRSRSSMRAFNMA